jgi:polar amino acid transport system substrate-binding protein
MRNKQPQQGDPMQSVLRRPVISAAVLALTIGAAAACGSSSSGGSSGGSGVNSSAAALVPASIKSNGTITVAEDASYAPDEFLASNGTTVIGMDADLANALGKALGLKVAVKNVTFNAIIPGLVDGRYNLGMSSFTDNLEREKQVNFVTYALVGTSFFVKADGGKTVTGLADLCGLKVSVESGTTQETDAKAQSTKCTAAGKPAVDVLAFDTQSEANLALSSGRADVSMADSPVAGYQVAQSNGAFKLTGSSYGTAPYGIAIPKQAGTMDQAVLTALKGLMADGTYAQIMKKWGLTSVAINNPVINGATS